MLSNAIALHIMSIDQVSNNRRRVTNMKGAGTLLSSTPQEQQPADLLSQE
jgi:hypothetical protein